MKILVYGANGTQAGATAQALMERGHQIRVLMRSEEKAKPWVSKGAEVVLGDMGNIDSLKRANEDCDAVFLLVPTFRASNEDGVSFGLNAVKAAKAAGISKIIWNTSGPIADENSEQADTDPGACILRQLKAEGLSFLGLQPTIYMENLLGPWVIDHLMTSSVLAYPIPHDFKIQWVAARDFGVVAAAALPGELPNEVVQLGGPQALDGNQLTDIFSRCLGRPLSFETMPIETFRDSLTVAAGPHIAGIVAGLYQAIQTAPEQLQPAFVLDSASLSRRFNVTLTSLESWISSYHDLFKS
ncbi:MAG: NmrA family NAD(P)-binding protein [Cyanobacteria bacterium P01_D01_bin.44]